MSSLKKNSKVDTSEIDAMFSMSDMLTSNKREDAELVPTELENKIKSKTGSDKMIPIFLASSGIGIAGDRITKSQYLESIGLDEDVYKNIVMTEDEANRFSRSLNRVVFGGATGASAIICSHKCKFTETCVTGDTKVLLHDGSYTEIKNIRAGEHVLSFSERERHLVEDIVPVERIRRKDLRDVFKITSAHGHELKMTACHRVYSRDGESDDHFYEWRSLDTGLKIGDNIVFTDKFPNEAYDNNEIYTYSHGGVLVTKIESIEYVGKEEVYDITVIMNNNFFANGILVHNCELYKMGKIKPGLPCIYEQSFIAQKMSEYMDEYDVDGSKPTERDLISKLVELELYERRANLMLATQHQDMAQEDFMGFDGSGAPIIKESTSRYIDIKDRFSRQRMKILEALMGTRKEKSKLAAAAVASNAGLTEMSSLKNKIEELKNSFGAPKGGFVAKGVIEHEK